MSVTARPTTLPLDEIIVSRRYRKDMGDLFALAASIKEVGLLHPVVGPRDAATAEGLTLEEYLETA